MFDTCPLWRLVAQHDVPRHGLYQVSTPTLPDMPMAFAFRTSAGGWSQDRDGLVPLGFDPQWFAPAPLHPPYPPRHLLPDGHPWKEHQ